ncbi:MAG: CoB--CoM heterodisulfide reductase iron-sulfur subunit A family protein [SAR324 cluster bacterium]|nr:CoB--CoM heterodisulfide reductase iron-sulfur subunit A family protein [SAR324 cluster bacterium]
MNNQGKILVIGGGISGVTTAIEASEVGKDVILVEKTPTLGGRVSGFHQYFPKLCPPTCGLEINYKRLRANPHVQVYTNSEVLSVKGDAGEFKVKVRKNPTFVNEKCVACDHCTDVCPSERSNDFNAGMDKTKSIFLPNKMAYPPRYVIDRPTCETGCSKCVDACKYGAIDLEMQVQEFEIEVTSVVVATGWKPYDAKNLTNLGFSSVPNVINNIMMERISSVSGPTKGQILRPSDQKPVETIAFVQCAGSRDENHLPYCSSICCLGSLKHTKYVLEQNPDAKIYIFYIDIRTAGKYEDFVAKVQAEKNVKMIKGKVAKISERENGNVLVEAEDTHNLTKVHLEVDMIVLATGMESSLRGQEKIAGIELDEYGFVPAELQKIGIFSAGVAKRPVDVNSSIQDSTGMALKAIQTALKD